MRAPAYLLAGILAAIAAGSWICVALGLTAGVAWTGLWIFTVLAMVATTAVSVDAGARWATAGTLKAGHHDPDNPLCSCGTCEATGRWLKRPLPEPQPPSLPSEWLHTVTGDCTQAEHALIASYLGDRMTTQEFLDAWATEQQPKPKPIPTGRRNPFRQSADKLNAAWGSTRTLVPNRCEHEFTDSNRCVKCGNLVGPEPDECAHVRAAMEAIWRSRGPWMPNAVDRCELAARLVQAGIRAHWIPTVQNENDDGRFTFPPADERIAREAMDRLEHALHQQAILTSHAVPATMLGMRTTPERR